MITSVSKDRSRGWTRVRGRSSEKKGAVQVLLAVSRARSQHSSCDFDRPRTPPSRHPSTHLVHLLQILGSSDTSHAPHLNLASHSGSHNRTRIDGLASEVANVGSEGARRSCESSERGRGSSVEEGAVGRVTSHRGHVGRHGGRVLCDVVVV